MGPLHGPMKEHSRALVMVIGDCMRTKKVGDCMQAGVGTAWIVCIISLYEVNTRCIGSHWPSLVYMHRLSWPSGVF